MMIKQNVLDMPVYAVPQVFDGVKLNQNESPSDLPREIKKEVFERLRNVPWNRYPAGVSEELLSGLSGYTGFPVEGILAGSSSNELIQVLISACCESGDAILTVTPTFSVYARAAGVMNVRTETVALNKDFTFNIPAILAGIEACDGLKIIFLASPNNPTGTVAALTDIEKIARVTSALVVIDEAYFEFHGESAQGLIETYPNIVVLRTFSKALQAAGVRLGYLLGSPALVEQLGKVKLPFSLGFFQQVVGEVILDNRDFLERNVTAIVKERDRVFERMRAVSFIEPAPSRGNFILFRPLMIPARELYELFYDAGVLVRSYGSPGLENMLRVTIGAAEENDRFLEVLKKPPAPRAKQKVVLLDMDGVLVDVSRSYREVIRRTVEYFSKAEVSYEVIQGFKDRGGLNNDWDLTDCILRERGFSINRADIVAEFQRFYLGDNFDGLILDEAWMVGEDFLEWVASRYRTGIVTGRPREEALFTLRRFGKERFFEVVVTMDDVPEGRGKPDPLGLRIAMKKLEVTDGWYIGDTVDDMSAAEQAGLGKVFAPLFSKSGPPEAPLRGGSL